jgi:hypothetical protein
MQIREDSRRLRNQHLAKEVTGWAEVGPGRPAQAGRTNPFRGPVRPPFDLAVIRAMYSPEASRHTSNHSPSAAEEQRREGHHHGEDRVEVVD